MQYKRLQRPLLPVPTPSSLPAPHAQEKIQLEEQIASLIQTCPDMITLRQIHAHILRSQSSSAFALSKLLAFCALSPRGDFSYARKVFDQMPRPNAFSWNSIIRGCPPSREPVHLYRQMLRLDPALPNTFTLAAVLKSCASVPALAECCQLHSHACKLGLRPSPFVQTALLNCYARCEAIGPARSVFEEMDDRNVYAWSAMICGYARVGLVNEALDLFREMQGAGVAPDEVTMASVVSACGKTGALDLGAWVHGFVEREGIKVDLKLGTALVDMYAKCGSIERAWKVFDGMRERDAMAWSTMIVGLAIHGLVDDALDLFERMQGEKVNPNQVTFVGVLLACAHCGLVQKGQQYWFYMLELGINPLMEHYGCMVDLLCRAGQVHEAYEFVQRMPISPNPVVWRTLLVGCRKNRILDKGEMVANKLLKLEPFNAENYLLLSNFYASNFQWERVSYLRRKMKNIGIKTVPGCSYIEVDGFLHEFVAGDESHAEMDEIRKVLKEVAERVYQSGHRALISMVLHDVAEEEKVIALCEHSERLAIAYGLMKTQAPAVIRIVKNLRVCTDCHEVTKIISKGFNREIIVRDRIRFHRFIDGSCSCNDFW